jgi:hypothetical protein
MNITSLGLVRLQVKASGFVKSNKKSKTFIRENVPGNGYVFLVFTDSEYSTNIGNTLVGKLHRLNKLDPGNK